MKTEFARFLKQVGLVLVLATILGGYPLFVYYGVEIAWAAAIGCGISTVNVLIGALSAIWSFDKPQAVFLKTLLGGMAIRMVVICIILVLLIKLTTLSVYGLVFSLFLFYVLFQILEVRLFVRRIEARRRSSEGV